MRANADSALIPMRHVAPTGTPGGGALARRVMRLQPDIIRELPDERRIRIDINGCHAGTITAIPDALEELALGWTVMHGFLDPHDMPERLTVDGDRVSIMVANGGDVDRRRLEAVDWVERGPLPMPDSRAGASLSLSNDNLIALIDHCWASFRHDDGGDGYHQAAVASATSVLCIARDREVDLAAAKVLGWLQRDGRDAGATIMLLRGMIGRRVVESAARTGLSMVVTSGIPTAEACRAAQGLEISLVGMAGARTVGVLIDNGHLISG